MSVRAASSARGVVTLVAAAYAIAALIAAFRVADSLWPTYGLRVDAYTTPNWTGRVVHRTLDTTLSGELLVGPEFGGWAVYSLEWNGFLVVSTPGRYWFALTSDDGSTLEIGNEVVVDNGGVHESQRLVGTRDLAAGVHPVRLRYFQQGGRYSLLVLWSPDGENFSPIPASRLLPDAWSYTAYRARALPPIAAGLLTLAGLAAVFRAARGRLDRAPGATGRPVSQVLVALERPGVAMAVLVVVSLAARVPVLVSSPAILWPDSQVFYETMRHVAAGEWTNHDAFRTLVYPQLMALFIGTNRTPAAGTLLIAAQQAMGVAAVVFVYLVGRRAWSPLVAFAGAMVFALHSLQLVYEITVQTEALFTCVLVVAVWISMRLLEAPTAARALATGMTVAVAVLVRPVAQWYLVGVLALVLLVLRPWRRALTLAALAAIVYAAPIVPLMALNQRDYGFWGVSLGQGLGLYTRVFDIDELVPPEDSSLPEMRALWMVARRQRWGPNRVHDALNYEMGYTAATADAAMLAFARETVLAHPVRFAVTSVWRWVVQTAAPIGSVHACQSQFGVYLCSQRTEGESLPPFPNTPSRRSAVRTVVVWFATRAALPMRVVFVLALVGAVAALRAQHRHVGKALCGLTILYVTLIPAVSQWPQDRYRLPVDALLLLFAAAGAREVGRMLAQTKAGAATA